MSMIKDNQRLAFVTIPDPIPNLMLFIDRVLFEIADGYRKEQQDDWSER